MAEPSNYSNESYVFRTDHEAGSIVIRPNQIIAELPPDESIEALNEAVVQILADMLNRAYDNITLVTHVQRVRGARHLLTVDEPNTDIIRLVRALRDKGFSAHPNHVYFFNSRPKNTIHFDPNMFAPNMFAPNMFAPNMFAPNMFAPNMFAPNMFVGSDGCCCPRGLSDDENRVVPRLAAVPVTQDTRPPAAKPLYAPAIVQVHIIDVSMLGTDLDGRDDPGLPDEKKGVDENSDGCVDPATGHGVFVKNILDRNSGLNSRLWEEGNALGTIDDSTLVLTMKEVVKAAEEDDKPDGKVLNLSLSGYSENDLPAPVLADQVKEMINKGWLIVASAGNDASCRLTWPGALPGVIAVGALNDCVPCAPAWFSNYGEWIDASAVGVNVVAKFPDLSGIEADLCLAPGFTPQHYSTGLARWSGTSFSTPLVAARLAAHLQANAASTNEDAIKAVLDGPGVRQLPYHGAIVA